MWQTGRTKTMKQFKVKILLVIILKIGGLQPQLLRDHLDESNS